MNVRILSVLSAAAVVVGLSSAASAQTAETKILPDETISGVEAFTLAPPPVGPLHFTLPIDVRVVKDASITTNTPITDAKGKDLKAWAELVRECLKSKPTLVRVVDGTSVPFIVNKADGKLKLNASDKPVCSIL
jgi:hypothetical protein